MKLTPKLLRRVRRLPSAVMSSMHNDLWHAERIDLLEEVSRTELMVADTGGGCTAS